MNDSIWATVLGIAKTLNITPEAALYDISYVNSIMYGRAMPMYGDGDDDRRADAPKFDASKDANNPDLFKNFTGEKVVKIR